MVNDNIKTKKNNFSTEWKQDGALFEHMMWFFESTLNFEKKNDNK